MASESHVPVNSSLGGICNCSFPRGSNPVSLTSHNSLELDLEVSTPKTGSSLPLKEIWQPQIKEKNMPKFSAYSGQHSAKHTLLDRGQWPAHSIGRCSRDLYQTHPSAQKYWAQVFYTEEFQHKISSSRPR